MRCFSYILLVALNAILVGCEQEKQDGDVGLVRKSEISAIPLSIPQTDLLGRFEGTVYDIAFWSHAKEPFRSGVLASNGAAGLVLVTVEGEATPPVSGNFVSDIAVTYLARGEVIANSRQKQNNESYANQAPQLSLIAAFDAGSDDGNDLDENAGADSLADIEAGRSGIMRFFTVDEEDNSFLELTLPGAAGFAQMPEPQAYCFGAMRGGNRHRLVIFDSPGRVRQILITLDNDDNLTVEEGEAYEIGDEVVACAGDPYRGHLYIATRSGDILEIAAEAAAGVTTTDQKTVYQKKTHQKTTGQTTSGAGEDGNQDNRLTEDWPADAARQHGTAPGSRSSPGPQIRRLTSLQKPIIDLGLILSSSGGPGATRATILALTAADTGLTGYVVDIAGGGGVGGVFNLGAFDDIAGVSAATAFAVGSGNLGGVYRRGALAVVDSGNEGALKLAPLSALSALLPDMLSTSAGVTETRREALKDETAQPIGPPIRLIPDEVGIDIQ